MIVVYSKVKPSYKTQKITAVSRSRSRSHKQIHTRTNTDTHIYTQTLQPDRCRQIASYADEKRMTSLVVDMNHDNDNDENGDGEGKNY